MFLFKTGSQAGLQLLAPLLPWSPKVLGLQLGSHTRAILTSISCLHSWPCVNVLAYILISADHH